MARCLAAEWACYGIRCNTISPGYMGEYQWMSMTILIINRLEDTILNEGSGLDNARNIWNSRNPMGRMGSPEELCGPLVMLVSPAGTYINGADIVVDGKFYRAFSSQSAKT